MHPVDISGGSYVDRRFILGRQWEADAARTNINFEVRVPPESDDGNSATSCGNSHYAMRRLPRWHVLSWKRISRATNGLIMCFNYYQISTRMKFYRIRISRNHQLSRDDLALTLLDGLRSVVT